MKDDTVICHATEGPAVWSPAVYSSLLMLFSTFLREANTLCKNVHTFELHRQLAPIFLLKYAKHCTKLGKAQSKSVVVVVVVRACLVLVRN